MRAEWRTTDHGPPWTDRRGIWNSILEMITLHLADHSFVSSALGCEFCGKIFKSIINLETHMSTVHLANLSFLSKALCCQFCGKNIEIRERHKITILNIFPQNSKHRASFIYKSFAKWTVIICLPKLCWFEYFSTKLTT